jgi:peptide deformylase
MRIITHPDKILNAKSTAVNPNEIGSKAMKKLSAEMIKTMLASDGAGLAAPQIGKNIRLAVINTKDGPVVVFNPKIIKKSLVKVWGEEGCLSVPGWFGEVKRSKSATCEYLDFKGEKKILKGEGMLARVIEHELDHLDGLLFISKARNLRRTENVG